MNDMLKYQETVRALEALGIQVVAVPHGPPGLDIGILEGPGAEAHWREKLGVDAARGRLRQTEGVCISLYNILVDVANAPPSIGAHMELRNKLKACQSVMQALGLVPKDGE